MSKSLADKLVEIPKHPEEMPESEQLRLIRKLDKRQRSLSEQLSTTKKQLKQAEDELATLDDFGDLVEATQGKARTRIYQAKRKKPSGQATAIMCATDWHAEERIDADTVNGLNEYNLEIADRRIERTFQKYIQMLEFSRGLSKVRDIVLWLGGDLINGYIHEELQESNFLGPAEAILWVQDRVSAGIQTLIAETDLPITVVTNYGNHGRATEKRRISTGYKTSWEWLAYNNLAKMFAGEPRVQWKVEKGYHNFIDIEGHPFRFHHGDGLKFQGGVGGLTIPVNKAIAQWNKSKYARFDIFGHYHTYMVNWHWLSVGCGCGFNAYATSIKADYQPPTQAFGLVDRDHGPVMTLPVFCERNA